MGTDGFEFIEYAAPDPAAMAALFERMGFRAIARHRHKNVLLYRQGGINFIVNAEPDSFAQRFARLHGPSICAIAFRVQDARKAYERAQSLGAKTIHLRRLHDAVMQKIDGKNASFWSAANVTGSEGPGLGLMERQRLRMWLHHAYGQLAKAAP
jgi:4-hydroxyphenylpyruvate dioxygenase-like putative hemolysin